MQPLSFRHFSRLLNAAHTVGEIIIIAIIMFYDSWKMVNENIN